MAASKSLTAAQRSLRARLAANDRWSRPGERARQVDARLQHFADLVDPDRTLPEPERIKLARQRRRAYMQGLALASSKVRTARKANGDEAA